MNRRNLLKLFGLLAIPTSAMASIPTSIPKREADHSWFMKIEGNYNIAGYDIEVNNNNVFGHDDVKIVDSGVEYDRFMYNSEYIRVSKNSIVTVNIPDKMPVTFIPQWDEVKKRFKTVTVVVEAVPDLYYNTATKEFEQFSLCTTAYCDTTKIARSTRF